VDSDGSIKIQQGTAGVNPSVSNYSGKSVIAEVRIVNGDTSIPASRITDVRAFMAATPATVDFSSIFGSWTNLDSAGSILTKNTVYKAAADGFITAYTTDYWKGFEIRSANSNPPTSVRAKNKGGTANSRMGISCPIKKNDYFNVVRPSGNAIIQWLPIGSGQCVKQ